MEEVGYAETAYPGYDESAYDDARRYDHVDLREPSPIRPAVTRYEPNPAAAEPGPRYDDGYADAIAPMMERALGEQIAEQRMIREALTEFDRRIEILERSTSERVTDLEHDIALRLEHFERGVTERMAAFELVLKRIVDRLTGFEERVAAGLDHNDKMLRVQLDSIRPHLDAAIERVVEWIEQLDAANNARLTAFREGFEAAVARSEPESAPPGATERPIRRDISRATRDAHARSDDNRFPGFEPVRRDVPVAARVVDEERGSGDSAPPRRRERPLRAKRDSDPR